MVPEYSSTEVLDALSTSLHECRTSPFQESCSSVKCHSAASLLMLVLQTLSATYLELQAALMALGLPEDIAEVLANEDIEYPLLAERIVAVRL
jgi:hypothetical protein